MHGGPIRAIGQSEEMGRRVEGLTSRRYKYAQRI
jgi:hypothetical protein